MLITVIIPTHNPDAGRLARTLHGLQAQTLPASRWHAILVDNASTSLVAPTVERICNSLDLSVVREPELGLTAARACGFRAARGELIVLADDDNVLDPDYLEQVAAIFAREPQLGAIGGKSLGEFEVTPTSWHREFLGLLAVRDLGNMEQRAVAWTKTGPARKEYPHCAPVGAGMALRRNAAFAWLENLSFLATRRPRDRTGTALTSGGDNDIVMSILARGWDIGYFPQLRLSHLIPAARLEESYLARLNRAIQRSWMQVLSLHGANPWPVIPAWTVPLRQAKAWFTLRAWSSPAARVRWQGACGHFEGRVRPLGL